MTAMPPAFPPQYPPGGPVGYGQQPRPANAWAIVSLVCGLIGCLVITPIVAIVTGVVGVSKSRQLGTGRGMAIAGIILGVLWCVGGVAAIGGGVLLFNKASVVIAQQAKPQTIGLINRVGGGDLTLDSTTGALTDADLKSIATVVKPLGACQDISVKSSSFRIVNNLASVSFDGSATFEHGTTPVHVRLHSPPQATPGGKVDWIFDELNLQ